MRILMAAAAALGLVALPATARPVSWPGGWTFLQEWSPDHGSFLVHYTPNRHMSVGPRAFRMRPSELTLAGANGTWLVNRWNMPGAQANLYLTGMAGAALPDGGPTRFGGLADVQADWENRRLMVMGMARIIHADGIETSNMQMFRAGFAPYVADYGGVHLWLFGQVRRDSASLNEVEPAFVARLFWKTMMVEAGVTGRGGAIANASFRF
jgi:hypothetical protein